MYFYYICSKLSVFFLEMLACFGVSFPSVIAIDHTGFIRVNNLHTM